VLLALINSHWTQKIAVESERKCSWLAEMRTDIEQGTSGRKKNY
jgi:hypothetical protein